MHQRTAMIQKFPLCFLFVFGFHASKNSYKTSHCYRRNSESSVLKCIKIINDLGSGGEQ